MQMENTTQDIKKVQDLINQNYSFFALDSLMYLLKNTLTYNLTTPLNLKDFEDFRFKLLDTSQNFALLASEDHVAYWNKIGFPGIFFKFCPERVTSVNLCIYLPKNSCLTEEVNEHIFRMKDNGFMHVFTVQTVQKEYLRRKNLSQEPKKLNLTQLRGANGIYFVGIFWSFIAFLWEVLRRGRG